MAKPNYQFEKRQRDLAKKQKQEEKRRQKLADKASTTVSSPGNDVPDGTTTIPAAEGESPRPEAP